MLAAKGDWIAFLDADDIWLPDKLEAQLKALQESDADLIFTNGWEVHEKNNELLPYNSLIGKYKGEDIYNVLFKHNPIAILSVMIRSSVVKSIGLQDENPECAGCEDWDYWLRCSKANLFFFRY